MINYSLPYVGIIILYIILGSFEIKENKYFRFLQRIECVIFVFFFGCRGYIGTDWLNYYNYYTNTSLFVWDSNDYEIIFSLVAKLFHESGASFSIWIFFLTLVQAYLFDRFFSKKIKYMFLAYIVLISVFPNLFIDTLRNFTALLIGVYSFDYWKKNEHIKAFLIILISILIHSSGIIFFVLLPFTRNYIQRKYVISFFVIGICLYVFQIRYLSSVLLWIGGVLGSRYEVLVDLYLNSDNYNYSYGLTIGIIEKIFFFILVLYKYNYIVSNKIIAPIIFNIFCLYIFSNIYLTEMTILVNRFAILFFCGYVIVMANIGECYYKALNRRMIYIFILGICLLKTSITYNSILFDYVNVLFQTDNIGEKISNVNNFYNIN